VCLSKEWVKPKAMTLLFDASFTGDSSNRPTIKLHIVTCIKDVSLQLSNVDKQFSQLEFKGYLICKLDSMLKGDISILKYKSTVIIKKLVNIT
jgi:hypothetical protein